MGKRIFLAIVLSVGVIALTQLIFPPVPPPEGVDSAVVAPGTSPAATQAAGVPSPQQPALGVPDAITGGPVSDSVEAIPVVRAETSLVATPVSTWGMSNIGASPVGVSMQEHRSLRNGARDPDAGPVQIVRPDESLLSFAIAVPGDTVDFSRVPFNVRETSGADGAPVLEYRAVQEGIALAIRYAFVPDSYLVRVNATVEGAPARSFLMVGLPQGLASFESDTADDQQHLAFAYKPRGDGAKGIGFGKLDPGERRILNGPHSWVATKSKYFIVGLLTPDDGEPFAEFSVVGGPRIGSKYATNATGSALMSLGAGEASFELYAGPQEWRRLVALGRDFKDSNPYGGFMQPIVQPFATIVMNVLLWMRGTFGISYGWVLVIFGVAVRLVMWPLNQKAMRAQLRMQRIQPELQAAQKKYPKDPQKQQQEIMRVYKEHGMSPFSTLSGCLPMLLPMPIFFALFFVFRNTIEFRGVPFLWLEDISLKDPYYILPLLMGLTTFLVSWIGMRGQKEIPQQQKMIMYVIPVTFTFVLLNMASGLNLYYTVQNLAALPQQWLIARERKKASGAGPAPVVSGPSRAERRAEKKRAG